MVAPSVSERYRSDGIGEVHGGRTPSHHLGDIMNGKQTILFISGRRLLMLLALSVLVMLGVSQYSSDESSADSDGTYVGGG